MPRQKITALTAAGAALVLGVWILIGSAAQPTALADHHDRQGGDSGPEPTARGEIKPPAHDIAALDARFGGLARLAGYAYEIHHAWADGAPIHARNEFRAELDGDALISKVFTTEPGSDTVYQRYFTTWTCDPRTGELEAHGVTFDGTAELLGATITEANDGAATVASAWSVGTPNGDVRMKQEIEIAPDGSSYAWRVWTKPPGAEEWMQLMDGRWERVDKLRG